MLEYNQDQNQNASSQTVAPLPTSETTVVTAPVIQLKSKHKWWLWTVAVLVLVLLGSGGWWYYAKGQVMLLAKDMTWQWGVNNKNYKIKQTLSIDSVAAENVAKQDYMFNLNSLKLDGFTDVVGESISGETNISAVIEDSGVQNFSLLLKYKKVAEIFYLSLDSDNELLDMLPIDLANNWIAIDQGALEENMLLSKESAQSSLATMKDLNQKMDKFLTAAKDNRLAFIKDPHESKESSGVKLKKINFVLNPEKIDEFIFLAVDNFADPAVINKIKQSYEILKSEKPEEWQMMQAFLKKMNLNFWVDTASKNIFGIELKIVDLDVNQSGQKLGTMSLNFNQEMELIEATEITVPESVTSIEEILNSLFMGVQVNDGEPVDISTILSLEQLAQLQMGVGLCLEANKTLNAPDINVKMCDDIVGVPNWPSLENDYQWSKEASFASADLQDFQFCVYSQNVSGVTCSQSGARQGCYKQACQENILPTDCLDGECISLDSDGDLLSDEEEMNEYFTNPNSYDTDSDGLDDGLEVLQFLTDPNDQDSDNDTYLDGQEVNNGYNPMGAGKLVM